jgi:hypothetical protein
MSGAALGLAGAATVLGVAVAPAHGPLVWPVALIPAAVAVWWDWGVHPGRAERALRTRDGWHSGVLAACPDPVVAIDPAGRVLVREVLDRV